MFTEFYYIPVLVETRSTVCRVSSWYIVTLGCRCIYWTSVLGWCCTY